MTHARLPGLFPFIAADWARARQIGHPQGSDVGSPFLWLLSFGEATESTSPISEKPSRLKPS